MKTFHEYLESVIDEPIDYIIKTTKDEDQFNKLKDYYKKEMGDMGFAPMPFTKFLNVLKKVKDQAQKIKETD